MKEKCGTLAVVLLVVFGGCGDGGSAHDPVSSQGTYTLQESSQGVTASFSDYAISVQYGQPFGITSLHLKGQPWDFVHPALPVGDWEWFWFDEEGRTDNPAAVKLLQPDWDIPLIEQNQDGVHLKFSRADAIRPGIGLEVNYRLSAVEPALDIEYSVHNASGISLKNPYVMVGFPGFTDHKWISSVATARELRLPLPPYANFSEEAVAEGKAEYTLLRDDVDLSQTPHRTLKGIVGIAAFGSTYLLQASYAIDADLRQIYSAHTNKPGYLTSHLYVFLKDLADGESSAIIVHYDLSKSP